MLSLVLMCPPRVVSNAYRPNKFQLPQTDPCDALLHAQRLTLVLNVVVTVTTTF